MKKFLLGFSLVISFGARAQHAVAPAPDLSPPPGLPSDSAVIQTIQLLNLKSMLNKEFSYILTGSSKSQVGNFASVNLTQPAATFNYSTVFKSGNVLSFNGTADLKNGLAPVFNNSVLNTDVSFQPKFSFLAPVAQKIIVNESDLVKYKTSYDNLTNMYNENLVISKNQLALGIIRQRRLKADIQELTRLAASDPTNERLKVRLMVQQDSLNAMTQHLRNTYQVDITKYIDENDPAFLKEVAAYQAKMKKTIAAQQKALGESYNPAGFFIKWFAISYKIINTSFSLFNPTLAYAAQVKKTNFIAHAISVEYDMYHYNTVAWKSWYLTISVDPSITDNLATFKTQNMEDIKTYVTTPGTRNSTKTYTAYLDSGKYKNNLKGIKLHADFFYFLMKNNQLAIHLNPQASYCQGILPEYDEGVGVLFSFKDSKDATGKAVVNTELFCDFMDITNSLKQSGSFTNRNTIGLRFSFPINFVNP